MPDISFLLEFIDPIILAICLAVGYVLKTAFERFPNKYIPLAALILGTVISVVVNMHKGIDIGVVVRGMVSGLSSTGMYEMLRNLLDWDEKREGRRVK